MIAIDLLQQFDQLGVRLWCEGDALKFEAPKGIMTADRINLLKQHKPDLLAHLSAGDAAMVKPLEPANDPPMTAWERIKKRAMGAYYYQLRQASNNLISRGYSDVNAMVKRSDWQDSIIKVMSLSSQQVDRIERELMQDGLLCFDCGGIYLTLGNGVRIETTYSDNADFILSDDTGRTFINWLYT